MAHTEYGIPPVVLMERAGLAVFQAVRELLPEGGRVTVFCGKGNNGGDGLVVARHLYEARYHVEVLMACTESDLSLDCASQLAIARAQRVDPVFHDDARWVRKVDCIGCRDLIVDALLGTGIAGDLQGAVLTSIESINRSGVPIVSVDIPSGVHPDTGEDHGASVWALRTITFGLPKQYLFQGIGMEHAGYWNVADIGYPGALVDEPTDARLIDRNWVGNLLPERLKTSHKGENGHVLIVGGSQWMPGAAVLAAKAALRTGAGLVTIASVEDVCRAVAAQLPEVLLLPLADRDGIIDPASAADLLSNQHKYASAVFGPGMTHEPAVHDFLAKLWPDWHVSSVIDADALNCVARGLSLPPAECILTPHPGEMSRLLQHSVAEIQANRFASVREASDKTGKAVLLKGPHSIVADQMQPLSVNTTGNPGMAAGGMGDILSGIIATLIAQDLPPYLAGACGAYWHGLAADICASEIGVFGYRASEVARALPAARAKITTSCDANSDSLMRSFLSRG